LSERSTDLAGESLGQTKTPQTEEFKHNRVWRAIVDVIATKIANSKQDIVVVVAFLTG